MVTTTTTLEAKVSDLEKKIARIEKKLDYLISLLEDENFTPEEVEELDELARRIKEGKEPTYPAEEVFKRLGLNVS